ncbi:hypothetical protein CHARACLAT_026749 [Characodon lateralis]|uniref:Uncharacterized protein n=1 Tax=Characodon lateralis TaxID=208331 RepID=A0ABU7DYH2_9TELE|nr:hypothetical protein [Characodon lateralis]
MAIQSSYIEACHTLPKKDKKAKPATIVRFCTQKHKIELLKQAKKLKGTEVHLIEHLTPKNAEIVKNAHQKPESALPGLYRQTRNLTPVHFAPSNKKYLHIFLHIFIENKTKLKQHGPEIVR